MKGCKLVSPSNYSRLPLSSVPQAEIARREAGTGVAWSFDASRAKSAPDARSEDRIMHRLLLKQADFLLASPGLSNDVGEPRLGRAERVAHGGAVRIGNYLGYRNAGTAYAMVDDTAPQVLDMESELAYWRRYYRRLPGGGALRYGDYDPAVKLGLEAYMRSHGRGLAEMEEELMRCYKRTRGASRLEWDQARSVVKLAWDHVRLGGMVE
jgi:hypothetical protein